MIDPCKIKKDFPMFENKTQMQGHDLVFLDNASTTFKPKCVIDAVLNYLSYETSNSHRGDYDLCFNVDQKVDEARGVVADLLNAEKNEIVFTSGATMSVNLVAFGYAFKYLEKGDEILLTKAEHASNILPWFKLCELKGIIVKFIPFDKDGRLTVENIKKTITNKTKMIAVAHVSNVLGYILDIKEITKIAHSHDILVFCDGAQSVPHMKVDVKDLDVDFLCFSAHKMCGPTGIGVLYGKYDLLDKMDPTLLGGGMNSKFHSNCEIKYLVPPAKFEAGTLNLEGIFGLIAAIKYVQAIGLDNIHNYESDLRKYFIKRIKEVKDIVLYNENAESGIVTFNIKNIFAQDLATYLNSRGIAVRSGQHCAKILPEFLNEIATCRASIYFYTTKEDIDALVDALKNGGDFLDAYFS